VNTTHPLARASVALVVGRRGSGKSELLRRATWSRPRVVVLDVLHGEPAEDGIDREGFATVEDEEEYLDALREFAGFKSWRIVVRPDNAETAPWAATALMPRDSGVTGYARAVHGVTFICDEVDLWAPNNNGIHPDVRAAVQRGRHYEINILAATRRPAECHRDISSQADVLVTFRQHEPRDVAWLAGAGGQDLADVARELDKYEYATFEADTGAVRRYNGSDQRIPTKGGDQECSD